MDDGLAFFCLFCIGAFSSFCIGLAANTTLDLTTVTELIEKCDTNTGVEWVSTDGLSEYEVQCHNGAKFEITK